MRMRITCRLLPALLVLLPAFARAEDESSKPLTSEQSAGAVVTAIQTGDQKAFDALARRDEPDPWLVVDELRRCGAHDAAQQFAETAPRPSTHRLAEYVSNRRSVEPDVDEYQLLHTIDAMLTTDPASAAEAANGLGVPLDSVVRIRLEGCRGLALRYLGELAESAAVFRRVAAAAARLGWRRGALTGHHAAGMSAVAASDWRAALGDWTHYAALAEELGNWQWVATGHANVGNSHVKLGSPAVALEHLRQALEIYQQHEDIAGAARIEQGIGASLLALGNHEEALKAFQRALAVADRRGDGATVAGLLGNIGAVYEASGAYDQARTLLQRSLALSEARGDLQQLAASLGNLGNVHLKLCEYANALACHERALEFSERTGDRAGIALALGNLGTVHQDLGVYDTALAYHERALALMEATGDRIGVARTLGNIGAMHIRSERPRQALACFRQSMRLEEAIGNVAGVAAALAQLGGAHVHLREFDEARSCFERALSIFERLGERPLTAKLTGDLGQVRVAMGDVDVGIGLLEKGVRLARDLRSRAVVVRNLVNLGLAHLGEDRPGRAYVAARKAREEIGSLARALSEEEGGTVRALYADAFHVGAFAAAILEEPGEVLSFLDAGRAGTLLEALGGRGALARVDLPSELERLESTARTRERLARHEHARALAAGSLRGIRAKARALDEVLEEVRAVSRRIQREAKREASLLLPRTATLETIRGWLEADEALVLYGLWAADALAVVVTPDAEWVVKLAGVADIAAACAALQMRSKDRDPSAALGRLRSLVVDPLRLPESTRTILVSPEGVLSFAPIGALFDRPVVFTPSASTHVHLREVEDAAGAGVLALGDPDYVSNRDRSAESIYAERGDLLPLEATREEALTIGEVVLLGSDANEKRLTETLPTRSRWRAVHLACHGLVDSERPTLSSLALTRSGGDDGFLTALEVLRMEIPADLVVLSACETGKGKIVKGEGIVGLTRAFMYAGAPRVICSLWKVDDEATRALMVKFYELWNPDEGEGLGAAEALKKAQEFVRSHEKWKHPYYWAAWVLWGLPG